MALVENGYTRLKICLAISLAAKAVNVLYIFGVQGVRIEHWSVTYEHRLLGMMRRIC